MYHNSYIYFNQTRFINLSNTNISMQNFAFDQTSLISDHEQKSHKFIQNDHSFQYIATKSIKQAKKQAKPNDKNRRKTFVVNL